jgi:type II secretory pathway pseudopilin PulG
MNKNRPLSGFTIVELVITIVIAGFIIPAVAIAITNLSVINKISRDKALANMLVQNKIETLRSAGYNALSNGTTSFASELPNTISSPKSAIYYNCRIFDYSALYCHFLLLCEYFSNRNCY